MKKFYMYIVGTLFSLNLISSPSQPQVDKDQLEQEIQDLDQEIQDMADLAAMLGYYRGKTDAYLEIENLFMKECQNSPKPSHGNSKECEDFFVFARLTDQFYKKLVMEGEELESKRSELNDKFDRYENLDSSDNNKIVGHNLS